MQARNGHETSLRVQGRTLNVRHACAKLPAGGLAIQQDQRPKHETAVQALGLTVMLDSVQFVQCIERLGLHDLTDLPASSHGHCELGERGLRRFRTDRACPIGAMAGTIVPGTILPIRSRRDIVRLVHELALSGFLGGYAFNLFHSTSSVGSWRPILEV